VAVTYDNSNAAEFSGVSGTQSVSLAVGTEPDRLLILDVSRYDGVLATLTNPVWNTTEAMTVVGGTTSGAVRQDTYSLVSPSSGTLNASITLDNSDQGVHLAATSYYDVDQATPLGTLRTNTGTTATTGWIGVDAPVGGMAHGSIVWDQGAAGRTISNRNGIPEWIATGTVSVASAAATVTGSNAPSGRLIGDIEIASVRTESGGAKTFTWTGTGWSKLGTEKAQSTNCTMGWAYRIYDGSNAAPVASWTGNSDAGIVRHLCRDSRVTGTVAALHGTNGSGTASPATSTGANTTANDVLAILFTGSGVNGAFGVAGGSWTERYDAGNATGPTRQAFDTNPLATSGSATGNTSKTNTTPVSWVSQQAELYQAANGDQTQRQNNTDIGNIASAAVATEVGDGYNTLGWTMSVAGATFAIHGFGIREAATYIHLVTPPPVPYRRQL
jgi:hypothetical protein